MTGKAFPRENGIREFKHDVYGGQQTAKITFDFLFFSCNPYIMNHTRMEKRLLLFTSVQRAEDEQQKFHFCRLP